jgi:hypothetical protein
MGRSRGGHWRSLRSSCCGAGSSQIGTCGEFDRRSHRRTPGPAQGAAPSAYRPVDGSCREEGPFEVAPNKAYLSLRQRKQFAMLKPAAAHVDLGLILPKVRPAGRFESAATFNALFTHRVRVKILAEIDGQLQRWLHLAYVGAEQRIADTLPSATEIVDAVALFLIVEFVAGC